MSFIGFVMFAAGFAAAIFHAVRRNGRRGWQCLGLGLIGLVLLGATAEVPEEAKARVEAGAAEQAADERRRAVRASCVEQIKASLSYPRSFDMHILTYGSAQTGGGGWYITFEFTAMNALGAELPFVARCRELADGTVEASVSRD
jgi:hypothetical protein